MKKVAVFGNTGGPETQMSPIGDIILPDPVV
jgi:hypothetical protein